MRDIVVVANRLPVDRVRLVDASPGEPTAWRRAPGGLVTAMSSVVEDRRAAWVGWTGAADDTPERFAHQGTDLVPVGLSPKEVEDYYLGFCNATLWPLYHDVIVPPVYQRAWWDAYVAVNRRFAQRAAEITPEGGAVWVHDYQLQLVPRMLRQARPDARIGFFLHIPFPPQELFAQLPWRAELIDGLLGADLIGFQRRGAAANFIALSRRLLQVDSDPDTLHSPDGRLVRVRSYPISIDVSEITGLARDPAVQARAREIRRDLGDPRTVLLGIDRLDYTKGIGHRLTAFHEMLSDERLDPGSTVFVQVATPSRERVSAYATLRDEIERIVGRINGEFGTVGHQPVHYLHGDCGRHELVALMLATDVMVVTPLRDGMNLVAKEFVAARGDGGGALVLSEFAGAADELVDAWMVNPHDIDGMKRTLSGVLAGDPDQRRRRMLRMHRQVLEHDVTMWAQDFLTDLGVPEPVGVGA